MSDTTKIETKPSSFDFLLTSPPYCTRIDYTVATSIELAVLEPLVDFPIRHLGQKMIGSTMVPTGDIEINPAWGKTCVQLLTGIYGHRSKASSGYYYKTHLDYFQKMYLSLERISIALKPRAIAIFIVQDSYYKDIHNDLPRIVVELCENFGLRLKARTDFHLRSMSDINPTRRVYQRPAGATESVICFEKAD